MRFIFTLIFALICAIRETMIKIKAKTKGRISLVTGHSDRIT